MRLTLRTLLAYLDGVLPAGDQADLATRVAASAVAQSLVARIRQVIRQPAVGSPRLEGRGLGDDANSVAEYLDNTLPSDRLESFERICIESDMHLAEVASCHAILAEVARDPAAAHGLGEQGRRRLLQAVRQRLAAGPDREEAGANGEAKDAVPHGAAGPDTVLVTGAAEAAATVTRPDGRGLWMAWVAAAAALLLIVSLGGVLVWSLAKRGSRDRAKSQVAAALGAPETAQQAPAAESSAAAITPSVSATTAIAAEGPRVGSPMTEPVPPVADQEPAGAPHREPSSMVPARTDEATVAGAPVVVPPAAAAATPLVPRGNALAIAAPTSVAAAPTADAAPPATEPSSPAGFVGMSGIIMHRAADGAWATLPPGAALQPREQLVVPQGFQPDINVGGVAIRLLPGTEAIASIDDDGVPRIEIVRGRVVARASRGDARLGITAAQLAGTVTAGLTTPIAAVVEIERAAGADPAASQPHVRGEIITTSGPIGWRQRSAGDGPPLEGVAAEGMLEPRSTLSWDSTRPTLLTIMPRGADPEWMAAAPPADPLEKRGCEALAAKVRSTEPLARGLRELAADRRSENRAVAAATLALLGDYDDLVELLCAEEPGRRLEARQWATLEAQGVSLALTRGAEDAAALRRAFAAHGPHGKGDLLDALARGFDDAALAAGGDRTLVDALDDPSLVVRRYAIKNLVEIVKPSATDRIRYRADGLPELRGEGAEWWRGQLEKGSIRRSPAT